MKAIITGITGQDGSHLADLLLEKGYEVVGISRRTSTNNTERISHILDHPKFTIEEGDITDVSSILSFLQKHKDVTELYNLAAQSHVAVSFKQPAVTWDITGKGVINLLQSLVDLNMRHVKFYQASSSEMFGKNYDEKWTTIHCAYGNEHDSTCEKYQDEDTKFMPQSPYAISKCAAHYAVRLYREAYGIHASAGILFNHEGPRRGENFVTRKITKWIGEFRSWCVEGKQFVNRYDTKSDADNIIGYSHTIVDTKLVGKFPKLRLGNLDAYRDWGYAGDFVEAMHLMLQQETPDDYVICTGETHTIREFLDIAFSFIGISDWTDFVVIDPEFYRPAEVDYLLGNMTKAKKKLNWSPKTDFKSLVEMMVKYDIKRLQ